MKKLIDVQITGGTATEEELQKYIDRAKEKYPDKILRAMDVEIDGDFVNLKYYFADVPFERVRRITGYLVGTLDRFNNAKRAEERARVKHSLDEE